MSSFALDERVTVMPVAQEQLEPIRTFVSKQFKGKKPPATANGITGKGRTLNSQPKKSESVSCVKRTTSSKYLSSLLRCL